FKPEDKPRLTDEFMAKIALEYMQMMGITDTQFIIVRHHNTTIHIVISCITASITRANSYQTGMITGVMSR
ncbi:Endonuclease relaxase, MobA/VirD2, partial [human gut metagenome]